VNMATAWSLERTFARESSPLPERKRGSRVRHETMRLLPACALVRPAAHLRRMVWQI
jgi:hypothetical protein